MRYDASDFDILSYLLRMNSISCEKAVKWAYSQYDNGNVEELVEKISLATSSKEIINLISDSYQVYGYPKEDFLIGEIAKAYSENKISLYEAISKILFDLNFEFSEDESKELYIAEDYFGWHENAESKAILHVKPILDKYEAIYDRSIKKFSI